MEVMAEPFTLLQPPLLFKPMLVLLQRRRCACAFRNIQQSGEHMGMLPCLILNGHRFELDRDRASSCCARSTSQACLAPALKIS